MRRHPCVIVPALLALVGVGCGGRSTFDFPILEESAPEPEKPDYCGPPSGACDTKRCDPPVRDGAHYAMCAPIDFETNPPTSGPHFPIWGLFKTYDSPLARGFYLHDVEHSGVVLAYNCDLVSKADCADLIATLEGYVADAPSDELCVEPTRHRLLVTPDPLLDVPFAAIAWGHSLKSECFDREAVDGFVAAFYGKNYENLCSGGLDPTAPDSGIEPGCGL